MSHDVFLSYSKKDQRVAEAVRAALERRRLRVWIDNKSISGGTNWADAIVLGLNSTKVMVLIFSKNSNASDNVKSEVERAFSKKLPLIPFRIENIEPQAAFEYFLGSRQWIDAYAGSFDKHLDRLCVEVRAALDAQGGAASREPVPSGERRISAVPPQSEPDKKWTEDAESLSRSKIVIGVGTGAVLGALIGLFLFYRQPNPLESRNPPVNTKENPGLLEKTPSVLPEMARPDNCHDTTDLCSNSRAAAPLDGQLTYDYGTIFHIKLNGVDIEIEGALNASTVSLRRLVQDFAKTKTIVHCVKNTSGKYGCVTVGTNENLADILARIKSR